MGMRRAKPLHWLAALLMLSGLAGSFPPAARASGSSHACCRGGRVCHCADHHATDGAKAGTDGCALRMAGCGAPAGAPAPGAGVQVVLAAPVPLIPPAGAGVRPLASRERAASFAIPPSLPPPRNLG